MALEERIVKKHLYEWLLDHNNLTIPQLGRFEATPTSATIQAGVYKFLPPNKKVTFHTDHDATDIELRDALIARENLTVEQANYTIATFVQKVKESLASRQRYELEGFGLLNQLNEHTVIFRIDEETNVEGNSYGLPGLYPKPLTHHEIQETTTTTNSLTRTNPDLPPYIEEEFVPLTNPKEIKATPSSKSIENDITIEEKRVNRSSNNLIVITLTAMFAVALVFVIWLIMDSSPLNSGVVNNLPKKDEKEKQENIPKKEEVKQEIKEEESKENLEKTPPKSTTPTTLPYTANGNYVAGFSWLPQPPANLAEVLNNKRAGKSYTVLGSFDKAENAYSFYNNLTKRGIVRACIIAPVAGNTRYRVCIGKFDTVEQATNEGVAFGKINATAFFVLTY